jgi:hypothetical protein
MPPVFCASRRESDDEWRRFLHGQVTKFERSRRSGASCNRRALGFEVLRGGTIVLSRAAGRSQPLSSRQNSAHRSGISVLTGAASACMCSSLSQVATAGAALPSRHAARKGRVCAVIWATFRAVVDPTCTPCQRPPPAPRAAAPGGIRHAPTERERSRTPEMARRTAGAQLLAAIRAWAGTVKAARPSWRRDFRGGAFSIRGGRLCCLSMKARGQ